MSALKHGQKENGKKPASAAADSTFCVEWVTKQPLNVYRPVLPGQANKSPYFAQIFPFVTEIDKIYFNIKYCLLHILMVINFEYAISYQI